MRTETTLPNILYYRMHSLLSFCQAEKFSYQPDKLKRINFFSIFFFLAVQLARKQLKLTKLYGQKLYVQLN